MQVIDALIALRKQ